MPAKFSPAKRAYYYTKAAEMYATGATVSQIAKAVGISIPFIKPALVEMGLWKTPTSTPSEEDRLIFKLKILSVYNEGENSATRISNIIGANNPGRVRRYLREMGLPTNEVVGGSVRSHTETFQQLDDTVLAYICGLISADGNIHKKTTAIRLYLQEDDLSTVRFVADSLTSPPGAVKLVKGRSPTHKAQGCYDQCLPEFKQYLASIGIGPSKSLDLRVDLSKFSNKAKLYFLRGAIDGDGCIHHKGDGTKQSQYSIVLYSGSKDYLEKDLQPIFGGSLSARVKQGQNPTYALNFHSQRARKLALVLPTDDFTMSRKTKKLLKLAQCSILVNRKDLDMEGSIWIDPYKATI